MVDVYSGAPPIEGGTSRTDYYMYYFTLEKKLMDACAFIDRYSGACVKEADRLCRVSVLVWGGVYDQTKTVLLEVA